MGEGVGVTGYIGVVGWVCKRGFDRLIHIGRMTGSWLFVLIELDYEEEESFSES